MNVMSGYTKLFSSILASTIWREDTDTRIVWITLLAMAGRDGVAEASVPGLADFARVSVEGTRAALVKLSSPDPDSRSKEYDGRRIEAVDGGWMLLNHAKYRAKMGEIERREYKRLKQAHYRKLAVDNRGQRSPNVDTVDTIQKQKQKHIQKVQEQERQSAPADPLAFLWNSLTTPPIPRCEKVTPTRVKHIRSRLDERTADEWSGVIRRIEASAFCRGQNDRGWVASFDWLIGSPDVAVKVSEGKYDNRPKVVPIANQEPEIDCDQMVANLKKRGVL